MKEISIFTLGDPGTFSLTPSDPMYYTERLSYELSKMLYLMNDEGFSLSQGEESDLDSAETALATWKSDFSTWYDAATSEGTRAILFGPDGKKIRRNRGVPAVSPPSFPVLSTIMGGLTAIVGGVPAMLTGIAVQVISDLIVNWIKNAVIPDTGDTEEIADILTDALLNSEGDSWLEILHQRPIEIMINKRNSIESVSFNSAM
jgi:hypothetical protein